MHNVSAWCDVQILFSHSEYPRWTAGHQVEAVITSKFSLVVRLGCRVWCAGQNCEVMFLKHTFSRHSIGLISLHDPPRAPYDMVGEWYQTSELVWES